MSTDGPEESGEGETQGGQGASTDTDGYASDGGTSGLTGGLIQATKETWSDKTKTDGHRDAFIGENKTSYFELIAEFKETADRAAELFKASSQSHKYWRWTVITGTVVVAVASLVVSFAVSNDLDGVGAMSLVSSVIAAALVGLVNLENFTKPYEKAQAFRESREPFLDAARLFENLWIAYVIPFEPKPEACLNAAMLHRMIREKDSELRHNLREITKTSAGGK